MQKQALVELIELFVSNMEEGHARVKMDEMRTPNGNGKDLLPQHLLAQPH